MGYVAQSAPQYQTWIPTYGGFLADPSSVTARYATGGLFGKTCFCNLNATAGTSNATTFTITLPVAAANTAIQTVRVRGTDNSTITSNCVIRTRVNSTTADVYPTDALGTWTGSGSKNVIGNFFYETI